MADIFISYRRGDWAAARLLHEALHPHFDVFLDVERKSIQLGRHFPDALASALAECKILLSVIGPEWRQPSNVKRLHDPKDWVRYEIETALGRQDRTRVLPLLMGTTMPDSTDLPPEISPLAAVVMYLLELGGVGRLSAAVLVFVLGGVVVEFWWPALALCVACWAYCKRRSSWRLGAVIAAAGSLWLVNRNLWALAAVPLMLVAPALDVPIPRLRHLFYAYYPIHLLALWAARRCLS